MMEELAEDWGDIYICRRENPMCYDDDDRFCVRDHTDEGLGSDDHKQSYGKTLEEALQNALEGDHRSPWDRNTIHIDSGMERTACGLDPRVYNEEDVTLHPNELSVLTMNERNPTDAVTSKYDMDEHILCSDCFEEEFEELCEFKS